MAIIPFDSLKFVNTLLASGMPEAHARALCSVVWDMRVSAILAERTGLGKAENALNAGDTIQEFMRKLEIRLTVKFGAMIIVGMAATAAIVKLI